MGYIDINFTVSYLKGCQDESGGFTTAPAHRGYSDLHLVCTAADLESLSYLNALNAVDVEKAREFILSHYREDEGFNSGPNETNYRVFVTCVGVLALYFLGELDAIDREKTVEYIMSCYNEDGGSGLSRELARA